MQPLERGMSNVRMFPNGDEIKFSRNESDTLSVTIDTQKLHLRSVNQDDCNLYYGLFNDGNEGSTSAGRIQSTTGFYAQLEKVKEIVNQWSETWENDDPYSSFAIFRKSDQEFIGNVHLGHGDEPGHSKMSCRFMKIHQGQGYGEEAITAVIKEYAPATIQEGYTLDGKPLERITTVVKNSNSDAIAFFSTLGMQNVGTAEKYGPDYSLYSLKV